MIKRAILGPNKEAYIKQQQHKQLQLELQLRILGRHSMHCTLPRTSTSNSEVEDRKRNIQSRKLVEKENKILTTKDSSEVNSAGWQDHDRRCAVYFLTPEPDGQCKLVAVPLRYVYHVNQLGSTTPSIAVSSPQPKNGGTENTFVVPKEETSKKRNSGKKKKKKAKNKKKLVREIGKTGSENVPQCGASQTGDNNDIQNSVFPLASETKLADPSPENTGIENCSEGTSARDYQCTSCIDEGGVLKSLMPSIVPNCSSDHRISELGDGIQTAGVQGMQCGVSGYPDVFAERPILGSPSPGSNCEKLNSGYYSTPCNEENDGMKVLKPPDCVVQEECPGNNFHDIVANDVQNQETNCSRQLCHLEMLEKRVKKIKRGPQNSGVCSVSSVRNLHRPGVRETGHSVWQKVQNSETCKHSHVSKNVNAACSPSYELKEASTHEKHINAVSCGLKSDSGLRKQTNNKVFAKTKRKNNVGSKQAFNNSYRNGSQAMREKSELCTSFNMQQNELCATPKNMNGESRPAVESTSQSKAKILTSGFHTRRVESIRLRRPESSQASINEAEPLESCYTSTSSLIDHNVECRTCHSSTSSNSLNTPELLEKLSDIQLHTIMDHTEIKANEDSFAPADHNKSLSSGAVLRNSVINDSSVYGGLSMLKIDESDGEIRAQKNSMKEDLVSDLCSSICAASSGSTCVRQGSNDVNSSPLTNVVQAKDFENQTVSVIKECSDSAMCFTPESSKQHALIPDDSNKLLSAVIDSHRAQVASEAIQLATGCPIAEFEKFLHSASPVICTSPTSVNCQKCPHDFSHAFLCQHEVPNFSLGELWQWYEKQGSYGLEVRVNDYENSCRLGIDRITFRAYFVPYLSAVQLFTKSKDLHYGSGISAACAMEKAEVVESSEISNINHLLSLLVPQPRESESMLAPDEHVCSKSSSGSLTKDESVSPADCGGSDGLEILFEYFESEQPQKRRPLYDMVNELVRGNASSRGRVLGDGTILKSVSICNLHPKSWYSVAWYPIYRIPEGNFRAAFLTYHSLGHLVRRQTASDSACMNVSVVSPVVGLQTYNTQGECWFKPRYSEDVLNSEPARILKERLRTLEQTASLMARALVTKGNEKIVNRQPDYEFFLSRQLY